MFKSIIFNLMMFMPLIINFFITMIMILPSKDNKFHPLKLMIILIIMIILITFKMNLLYYNWMPFILFLSMIGGLMIIFMYITSLTNNNFFHLNLKSIMINFFKIFPIIILMFYIQSMYPPNLFINFNIQDSWIFNKYLYMNDQLNLNIMYNEINYKSSLFIMLYIYYSMICIMNICYKLKMPLRQLMY